VSVQGAQQNTQAGAQLHRVLIYQKPLPKTAKTQGATQKKQPKTRSPTATVM